MEIEPPLPVLESHTPEFEAERLVKVARFLFGANVLLLLACGFALQKFFQVTPVGRLIPYLLPLPSLALSVGGIWFGLKSNSQDGKVVAFVSALLFLMFFGFVLPLYRS